jgi:superfamily II DNA/RNA helicase
METEKNIDNFKLKKNSEKEIFLNNFKNVGFIDEISQLLVDKKFKKATNVQKRAIPLTKEDLNLIVSAPTGSGKTLIYINRILEVLEEYQKPQAIILVPTKELVVQVKSMFEEFKNLKDFSIIEIFGGLNQKKIEKEIKGKQIIISTPNALIKYLNKKDFENIHMLIFDEVDLLLNKETLEDIEKIVSNIPRKRQTLMFSATINKDIAKFAQKYTKRLQKVIVSEKEIKKEINYTTYEIESNKKLSLLNYILNKENFVSTIIFINRKEVGEFIKKNLKIKNMKIEFIHKELSKSKREKIIDDFRDGKIDVLIATDAISRGFDLDNISHIINYNIPKNIETYTHRIGRCARGEGKSGYVIDFVTKKETEKYINILNQKKIKPLIKEIPENLIEIEIKHEMKKRDFKKKFNKNN